ncbi:3'(2'),5'-bisphosphate nucleotidase CysQ [Sphingomonas sp. BGYR3]|uniref:3'(2'),5'-bisphosphate nucleotidase CysQ n=1 Tax=Sphingomonas sp. BGYR3 TaxID=2975483 RepID=UPI0021A3052D|nr:3'(2'),5'-bisphosphate nucleotidase CysQ [Sphingomonas sp. BGYR3]MDG5487011.1 3'(2'),5'-bisphosphate nucleotidase CysQ [Sphingomonas sp. BGYR3]
MSADAMTDVELARSIAEAAGRLLMDLRAAGDLADEALGAEGDRAANALILERLAEARPDDAVLSEESADSPDRLNRSRVWIIDPLDGTREYREGRDDWAVHIALAIDGKPAIGAVALPALGRVLDSAEVPPAPPPANPPRMLVSRSRPGADAMAVAEALGAELVPMGSAGAKAMAVVRGEADIYLHSGGQYEWDNCAPAAVALAAGLHASRIDGSPLRYNRADPMLPDLLICAPDLARIILPMIETGMARAPAEQGDPAA